MQNSKVEHALATSPQDILGAEYCGVIPWVLKDVDTGEPFVIEAHYYVHDDDRHVLVTDEADPDICAILLEASDALHVDDGGHE